MGRKRNIERARVNIHGVPPEHGTDGNDLRLIYWNTNVLMKLDKKDMIAETIIKEKIDILFVDETHLSFGTNEDLSCFVLNVYTKERDPNIKTSGGKLALICPNLNHIRWDPSLVLFPYLDNERMWILIHENPIFVDKYPHTFII